MVLLKNKEAGSLMPEKNNMTIETAAGMLDSGSIMGGFHLLKKTLGVHGLQLQNIFKEKANFYDFANARFKPSPAAPDDLRPEREHCFWLPATKLILDYIDELFQVESRIEEGILNDMTIAVSERLSFVGSRDETGRKTREKPSLAQVAGIAAYWMAKLKPCFMDADSPNKLYVVNEVAAIFLGLSICLHSRAKIPQTTPALDERLMNSLKKRILNDWVTTLRYYNNSTDSLVLPFNIIISSQKL